MKVAEVLHLLHADGWRLVRYRGSHRQLGHLRKPGRVTVPGKPSDDLAPGTLKSIFKQAGLHDGGRMSDRMKFAVVIEQAQGNFSAYVPDLPGCVATGATLDEVEAEIRGAIAFHVEGLREDGLSVPQASSRVEYIEITA